MAAWRSGNGVGGINEVTLYVNILCGNGIKAVLES